jgi:hypothetical protein
MKNTYKNKNKNVWKEEDEGPRGENTQERINSQGSQQHVNSFFQGKQ